MENKDMEKIINARIEYLNSMYEKYEQLNKRSNNKYSWRLKGIAEHINSLETLFTINYNNDWNECYTEDSKDI